MSARGLRYAALLAGEKFYMPDKPCIRGHTSVRDTQTSTCVACKRQLETVRTKIDRVVYNERKRKERSYKLELIAEKARLARKNEPVEKRALRLAKAKQKAKEWRAKNPKHHLALTTAHKQTVKLRTPKWVNLPDIVAVYKNCPPGHQVDHIVPLRHKLVSGLHVPWNLQYLKAAENRAKSNYFELVIDLTPDNPNKYLPK